jgi:hypothetical protein
MALYELRTYTLHVGKMKDAVSVYQDLGWPAIQAGGFDKHLVGYFTSDVGTINQLVHMWRFDDDADRRAFWKRLFADEDFMAFVGHIRPLIQSQHVQLLLEAPWGPHPS